MAFAITTVDHFVKRSEWVWCIFDALWVTNTKKQWSLVGITTLLCEKLQGKFKSIHDQMMRGEFIAHIENLLLIVV